MSIALTVMDTGRRGNKFWTRLKAVFGTNYSTGGDTADLTAATNPSFLSKPIPSRPPKAQDVVFQDVVGGYKPEWVEGTTLANGKIQLFTSGNSEFAAGAYNAAQTGDELFIEIQWPCGT